MTPARTTEALWPYALEVYGRPGVEPLLLRLQDDHDQCVPFLLWSLWMAAGGRPIDRATAAACAELARAWQDAAVVPLRRLRRGLKAKASQERLQARIRTGVQALELEAERMLLQMLEESSPAPASSSPGAAPNPPAAALARAIGAGGAEAPSALLRQLAALCA